MRLSWSGQQRPTRAEVWLLGLSLIAGLLVRLWAMRAQQIPGDRISATVCDLGIGALIFIVSRGIWRPNNDGSTKTRSQLIVPTAAALAWLLNPGVIILSASWGQIEPVSTLLLLLSVLLLAERPILAAVSLVLAVMVAPWLIVMAPLVLVVLVVLHPLRRAATAVVAGLIAWFLISAPFFGWNASSGFFSLLYRTVRANPVTSLDALNLWGIGGWWKSDTRPVLLGIPPLALAAVLFIAGICYGLIVFQGQLRRREDSLIVLVMMAAYFAWLPYTVLTRVHDRWLYHALPFLLLLSVSCLRTAIQGDDLRGRRFLALPAILYAIASLLFAMNLYRVYIHSLYGSRPIPGSEGVYHLIDNAGQVWAVLAVMCFWAFAIAMPWWLPPGLLIRGGSVAPMRAAQS